MYYRLRYIFAPLSHRGKGAYMNGFLLPPTLILSGLLAVLAFVLNFVSPGAAALVGAIAALLFIKLLLMGR